MNAVEMEAAVSDLAAAPFDAAEFPFQFLAAFDKKETQLKRLRKGDTNHSDVPGGVLLQANIHMAVCAIGETRAALERLNSSPQTAKAKAKFILATDGQTLEAEELATGESIASEFPKLAEHVGFFLPLAGITTVREIKDNPIDVRATGRLNKLYVELLRQNPEWGTDARRHDMNHFMARLIFCFFAEDTDIFNGRGRFTQTVEQFSESDGSNTHQVIESCFRAMNTGIADRAAAGVPPYADAFPYVNGGLFAGSAETPRFTRIARSYLLQAGSLDWQHINPDIFGSMIQAVADERERGALGMHYTSVPNILKVLNPLFLDELRAQLEAAGSNERKLLNLRKRISRIRVFDPACGSGNFLVIAYKQLRAIEAEINARRGEHIRGTEISKKNFRGIEIRDFAAEIARLALVIAEYQCDVLHRGPLAAKAEFLPLDEMNWIVCGNALRLNWLEVCPLEGASVKLRSDDLFQTPLEQSEIDFENEGGEVLICGNPPYMGDKMQLPSHKFDVEVVLSDRNNGWRSLDYVCAFFQKAADYAASARAEIAFVTTKSITQGQQVPILWPLLLTRLEISFARRPFEWNNLASSNAGVTCVIIGLRRRGARTQKILYEEDSQKVVDNISPYLLGGTDLAVQKVATPINGLPKMILGNVLKDDGQLQFSASEISELEAAGLAGTVKKLVGSTEFVNGSYKHCLYMSNAQVDLQSNELILGRLRKVCAFRSTSRASALRELAMLPNLFYFHLPPGKTHTICIPRVTSENRDYLPVGILPRGILISDRNYGLVDAPLWVIALIASRLHLVWIGTVCVRMRTDFSYSNTLGWNTFPVPVPPLTEQDKADLTRCAEDILLAREAHFPATIADLYAPDAMPENLREAHNRNDETLERIYIGRRFKNDTERLETLFAMYAKMTEKQTSAPAKTRGGANKKQILRSAQDDPCSGVQDDVNVTRGPAHGKSDYEMKGGSS